MAIEDDAESVNDEEVWACLTSADLAADLATLDALGEASGGAAALGEEVTRMLGEAAVISSESEEKIASRLQKLCADAEQLQFNLASMVAKVVPPGPLAPPGESAESAPQQLAGAAAQKIFGQVVPPSSLQHAWPSGAQSMAEYEQRLAALPDCVAITRELQLSLSKLDCRQDEKDINRDTLEVNGLEVKGSEGGYHKAVATISDVLSHGAVRLGRSKEAAQMLLSILNRTTSGFMAFEEVLKLLENGEVVISPQSAQARPLELAVVGPTLAMGRAHTRYAVFRADASGQLLAVDAFVCFKLELETLRKLVEEKLELQVPANILIYKSN